MKNVDQNRISFDDHFQEGTRLLHQGNGQAAIPFLKQAVQLQPENVDAAINLSGALILEGQFRQAIAILEPLKDRPLNNAMLWINLGAAYLGNPILARESEQKLAIKAFECALEIDPLAPSVAYNIGLVYEDRKEFEESIFWYRQAVQANPRDDHARRKIKRLEGLINPNDDVPGMND